MTTVSSPPAPAVSADLIAAFKAGMQRLAAAPCVLTTQYEDRRFGLTASAVCSLTADPPTLIACVNESAEAWRAIDASGRICVNVLAASQVEIAQRFAGMLGHRGEARFEGLEWDLLASGAPVLRGALAAFDCTVAERVRWSTHTAFICRVEAATVNDAGDPLVYANRQFLRTAPL
jgi:flavin reductase (DIM6/NTAB) family NADH-FMN oxidoreductase RutF